VGLCIGLAVVALLLAWRVRQVLWGAWPAGGKPPMLFRRTRRRAGAGDPATASSGAGPLVTDADAVPALGPDSGVAAARVALPGEGIGRRRIEPVPGTDPCSTTC